MKIVDKHIRSVVGMQTRRRLIAGGFAAGGAVILQSTTGLQSKFQNRPSPRTTAFVEPLPVAPILAPLRPASFRPQPGRVISSNTAIYEIDASEAAHSYHRELPPTSIWGYNAIVPGPTILAEAGTDVLVRFNNRLPVNDPAGIGLPINAVHRHGGFQLPKDDGYPFDFFNTGSSRDYVFPNPPEDSTLWYHDHSIDITAENVYRGLAGFYLIFDTLDSMAGELDPNPDALRLPGRMVDGTRLYDIPLVFQDRQFAGNGALVYDSFEHNGFIGDKFTVNGKIQPFLEVEPRKYRFRFLNGSNARQYEFVLRDGTTIRPFDWIIGTDDRLLEHPLANIESFRIASAERVQAVIDFSRYAGKEILLVNRLAQSEGRKPDGVTNPGTPILKFRVSRNKVPDPSRVPSTLRRIPPAERPEVVLGRGVDVRRTFEWGRQGGAWAVNGELFDENRISARPVQGEYEIWDLTAGGGWEHPIHIHLSNFFVIARDGKQPPLLEQGWKDTVVVGGDRGSARILIKFAGFTGKYAFHCHTVEHEDARMMANFEVQPNKKV